MLTRSLLRQGDASARPRFLSDGELARFLEAVGSRSHHNSVRDRALFAVLATTGIRPSEALSLTTADIHLRGQRPWVRIVRLKKKKTVREFTDLVIPGRVALALKEHLNGLDQADKLFRITRRQVERLFHYYAKQAGIRGRYLYVLRHTAATRAYRATRDIKVVQELLGHERPETSSIYAHVPVALIAELADQFPAVV